MRVYKKPYKPGYVVTLARKMRHEPTEAESIVWEMVRNRKLEGLKFRRQVPYGRYILDFYCKEKNLAIELDGGIHRDQVKYNEERDRRIKAGGISVLRISNDEIVQSQEAVHLRIKQLMATVDVSHPSPVSGRGAGG